MPTECIANPLQRELADSIIRMVPLDEIRILLACGAKVNNAVTQGLRPLHYAVWQKYAEAIQLLLTRGADINTVDDCGYSALHLAAEHGYTDLVTLLLANGAKVNHLPPTDAAFPRTIHCDEPLRLAIRNRHTAIVRMLLEGGADPNRRYFFGAEINLTTDLDYLQLLLAFGADPDSRDRAGLTPLMKAVRQPTGLDAALLLIKHGADVNAMADHRNDYRTVLHYAVLSGNMDIISLVIKQGGRLNYDVAFEIGKPSPLDLAILKGDPGLVQFLIQSGADVNVSSPLIGSPLHVACADNISNRYEIIEMLLERGADPNLKVFSGDDTTELHSQLRPVLVEYLASNAHPSIRVVHLLIRYGARVIMKTQFRDPDGMLNCLQNLSSAEELAAAAAAAEGSNEMIFHLLCEASESFDPCMIRRCAHLTHEQRRRLLHLAAEPLTLRSQVRLQLRRHKHLISSTCLTNMADDAILPRSLVHYLAFDTY